MRMGMILPESSILHTKRDRRASGELRRGGGLMGSESFDRETSGGDFGKIEEAKGMKLQELI